MTERRDERRRHNPGMGLWDIGEDAAPAATTIGTLHGFDLFQDGATGRGRGRRGRAMSARPSASEPPSRSRSSPRASSPRPSPTFTTCPCS